MTDMVEGTGNVMNPFTAASPDNTSNPILQGRNSELLVSQIHGKWFNAAARGVLFTFNVTAKTVPVTVSAGQITAAPFALYNPVGSNRLLELIDLDIGLVLATTVVNTISLYATTNVVSASGTFTTAGTAQSGLLNGTAGGVGVPYTAYTTVASCTPLLWMPVGTFGAVTTTSNLLSHYVFDGKAIVPPGALVILAASTAASTASSIDAQISWVETPIVL